MKKYQKLVIEILDFSEDIITSSNGFTPDDNELPPDEGLFSE